MTLDGPASRPCWTRANRVDEVADTHRHPDATTFDGRRLAEERAELDLGKFTLRFEATSGYAIDDLASRFRSRDQAHGRIVVSTLAA